MERFVQMYCFLCLIGSSYASGLGIFSAGIFIDYSTHLLELVFSLGSHP